MDNKFIKKYEKDINTIIIKFNNDILFKKKTLEEYNNNPLNLSIPCIYAIEEILRIGNKNILSNLMKLDVVVKENISLYDISVFMYLFKNDTNFKEFKLNQLKNNPNTLSKFEKTFIKLINEENNNTNKNMSIYDDYNPILYDNGEEIRTTITNLVIGKFILDLLKTKEFSFINERQAKKGMFSNEDKIYIIDKIYNVVINNKILQKKVDKLYFIIKLRVLKGEGIKSFDKYLQYNTNISIDDILKYKNNNCKKKTR